jgi:hypothetical protein
MNIQVDFALQPHSLHLAGASVYRPHGRGKARRALLLALLIPVIGCGFGEASSERPQSLSEPATSTIAPVAVPAPGKTLAASTTIQFTDVTAHSGVQFNYQNGTESGHNAILESLGGGVGMVDYDGDGRLDLFFPAGGGFQGTSIYGIPSVLYRNLGAWRFENVSVPAGDGFLTNHYTHGCFAADYDNDGFVDLLVTGYGGLQLWGNQGDGTFEEVAASAGLEDPSWSSAAAWGDVNNDGVLDLYVAHYVNWSFENNPLCHSLPGVVDICPPKVFNGLDDRLFLGNGDGTFRDVTDPSGLRPEGQGLGVLLGDVDLDGDLDIYVANDTTDNFLYINTGSGEFREEAAIRGVAVDDRGVANGSMGVSFGDYNLDGLPDIWVANFEVESFAMYRNEGAGNFHHVSRAIR